MTDFGSAALAFQGAQGANSVLGARSQANAISAQSTFNQMQAGIESRRLTMQAQDAETRGTQELRAIGDQANQVEGTERARMAAAGVDPNSGSALAQQQSTEQMSALDKLTVRNNAAREAYGFNSQAAAVQSGATMQALAARNAARQTLLSGFLTGAKDVYSGLYDYNKLSGIKVKVNDPPLYVVPPAGKNMSDPRNR